MIEKTVYLIRHGESVENAAPVFQSPDSPLPERGKMQAGKLAVRISQLPFDAFIASPYRRAVETAEAIERATGKTAEFSGLFVERRKPTSVDGKAFDDAVANDTWKRWNESMFTSGMRVEDGENFDDIAARADDALAYLSGRSESSILVVTHGFFMRTIVARVLTGALFSPELLRQIQYSASIENTGITALQYETSANEAPRWRLWIYNDHEHLG